MTILTHSLQFNSASGQVTPAGWVNCGAGNSTGVKAADINGSGISFEVTVASAAASLASSTTDAEHYGIPEDVWDRYWVASSGGALAGVFDGFIPNQPVTITFFGTSTASGRGRSLTINGINAVNDNTGGTNPLTPDEPTTFIVDADENGELACTFGWVDANAVYAGMVISHDDAWAPEPTDPDIADDSTDLIIQNGETQTISFIRTVSDPVSLAIIYDDTVNDPIVVSQADFALVGTVEDGAVSATFTCTRGSMPYTDNDTYEPAHYRYVATCADDSEIELVGLTLLPQDDRAFVTAVDPVNDSTSIIQVWVSGGAITGDQIEYPPDQCTVRPDFTFFGEAGSTKSFNIEYFDSENFEWYTINVTVSFGDDGEGTVITARGFTAEGFTVRGFTVRGF